MNLSGENLGKYEIIERLGQGGMAQVYKAFQPGIERFVAIKVLHSHLAEDGEFVARFQREAQSLGQLNHPSILRVIDFEEADGTFFLVMDFIRGETLQSVLRRETQLPVETALRIVQQLADALDYAHSNGTVHRDIKPANIMFSDETLDNPVLTDFGIARLLDNATLTMSGAIAGTPAYISPEVAQGEKADGRSDIYSLGVVLYEMVTGRPPYMGDTPLSIILKQATEPVPVPTELNPNLPLGVERVLHRALAKIPEDRFQTAGEFRDELTSPFENAPTNADATIATNDEATVLMPKSAATPVDSPTEAPKAGRPAWLTYVLSGLMVVAVLAIGAWLLFGGGGAGVAEETAVPDPIEPAAVVAAAEPTETMAVAVTEEIVPTATEAIVPTATLVPPTATLLPTATPTPLPPPIALPEQFGELRYTAENQFVVTIDRVPLPRSGTEYVLWLEQQGEVRSVGTLPIVDALIRFTLEEELVLANTLRLFVTEQPLESAQFDLTNVRFEGELPSADLETIQSLFTASDNGISFVGSLRGQAGTAVQHAGFMNESLLAGNLDEAKVHAEHVVNILDGEAGQFFGDLNLDGQTQNPGDGVGVRVYFAQFDERLASLVLGDALIDRQIHQVAASAAIGRALGALDDAIGTAQRVTAADTAAEAMPLGNEVVLHLNEMVNGSAQLIEPISDGQGGLETAVAHAIGMAAIPVERIAANSDLPAPDPAAHLIPGRVGLFQLRADEGGQPTRFVLQMSNLPPAPPDNVYAAWLINPTTGETILLATAPLENGRLFINGALPQPYQFGFSQVGISFALADQTPAGPEPAIFSGTLGGGVETAVLTSLDGEIGTLVGAQREYALALNHATLMREALLGGDLAEGQRHAEHVVNILEGEVGENFGDLNGDGQPQNPGDGVGATVYLAGSLIEPNEAFTPNQQFQAARVGLLIGNANGSSGLVVQTALQLIGSESLEAALPFAEQLLAELTVMRDGEDQNEDGLIDPLLSEGGITAVNGATLALIEMSIFPNNSSTMARFTLVRADDPDKIGVMEAKPPFGTPAVGNPFYCPLLPPAGSS